MESIVPLTTQLGSPKPNRKIPSMALTSEVVRTYMIQREARSRFHAMATFAPPPYRAPINHNGRCNLNLFCLTISRSS